MRRTAILLAGFLLVAGIFLSSKKATVRAQQYAKCVPTGTTSATVYACQSAAYGVATFPITTNPSVVTIYTTAVTKTSPILLTYDYSLGTPLGVTCNVAGLEPEVIARSPGAFFEIQAPPGSGAFTSNAGCFSWRVIPQ